MKINHLAVVAVSLLSIAGATSCEESNSIGSSLIQSENSIIIEEGFTVKGTSIDNSKVQSRTIMQLLGEINAKGYGKFRSDFVTQFMPAAALDSTLVSAEHIDSVKLLMMFNRGSLVGDSVIPMGLEVYRLTKNLPVPIFSDFDPEEYYDRTAPIASKVYSANNIGLPTDSLKKLSYREIYVDLPRELGMELFDLYKTNPSAYLDPTVFSNYFHGLYVKSSYGSGRVTKIGGTLIQLYYHYNTKNSAGRDTTYNYTGNFYSVSPEIVTNNNIDYTISSDLTERIADGENIIVAPAGIDVEIQFPLLDVISKYNRDKGQLSIINDLTFSIPASKISNSYNINPPENILLVLKDKKDEFFGQAKITDSKTSFYATYDTTTGMYKFSSMRQYLLDALTRERELTPEDYTFVITPVTINKESTNSYYGSSQTSYITSIVPYVEQPAMAKLDLENAKIILTFSNQNLKN